jgi:hypothetical protein
MKKLSQSLPIAIRIWNNAYAQFVWKITVESSNSLKTTIRILLLKLDALSPAEIPPSGRNDILNSKNTKQTILFQVRMQAGAHSTPGMMLRVGFGGQAARGGHSHGEHVAQGQR